MTRDVEYFAISLREDSYAPCAFFALAFSVNKAVVRLPIACPPPSVQADDASAPSVAPVRLLIVDDRVDATEALGTLLELEGHEVKRARSDTVPVI